MLEPIRWQDGRHERQVHPRLRYTDDLPNALRRRMAQMERIQRGLAGYCHAVSIMLQIPGGAEYRSVQHERSDFYRDIWHRDPGWPITVLTQALAALDATHVLPAPFRGRDTCRLPKRARGRLSGLSRNSLLNVVAECLDRLLIVPLWEDEADLMDVGGPPEPSWWDRLNTHLRAAVRPKADKRAKRRTRRGKN